METRETAGLTLRTWDILQNNTVQNNTDNAVGTITANNARITWKNINLRHVIGQAMWDKYDKFNLELLSYGMRPPASAVSVANRTMSFWISGLPFSNQTYSVVSKGLTDEACMGIVMYNNTVNDGILIAISNNVLTFNKTDNPIVNITIDFKCNTVNTVDGFLEKPSNVLGHHTFLFNIVGCDDYKKTDVSRRF